MLSVAKHAAPGNVINLCEALKERQKPIHESSFALSVLVCFLDFPGAACFAALRTCPWLPYCAPSARRKASLLS